MIIAVPYPKLLGPGEYQAELVLEIGDELPVGWRGRNREEGLEFIYLHLSRAYRGE